MSDIKFNNPGFGIVCDLEDQISQLQTEVERLRGEIPKARSLICTAYQEVREFNDYNNSLSHMLEAVDILESLMGYKPAEALQQKKGKDGE